MRGAPDRERCGGPPTGGGPGTSPPRTARAPRRAAGAAPRRLCLPRGTRRARGPGPGPAGGPSHVVAPGSLPRRLRPCRRHPATRRPWEVPGRRAPGGLARPGRCGRYPRAAELPVCRAEGANGPGAGARLSRLRTGGRGGEGAVTVVHSPRAVPPLARGTARPGLGPECPLPRRPSGARGRSAARLPQCSSAAPGRAVPRAPRPARRSSPGSAGAGVPAPAGGEAQVRKSSASRSASRSSRGPASLKQRSGSGSMSRRA